MSCNKKMIVKISQRTSQAPTFYMVMQRINKMQWYKNVSIQKNLASQSTWQSINRAARKAMFFNKHQIHIK